MKRNTETLALLSPSPGTSRALTVHRYGGKGKGPKAYIQASLHADEWPGLLVAQHLLSMLDAAAEKDAITGEIVIVPYANPIGLSQQIGGHVPGRYSLDGSGNFNRNWPQLGAKVSEVLKGKLTGNAESDVATVRSALLDAVSGLKRRTEVDELKATLLSLSIDSDVVLDLHCDGEALLHIYSNIRHEEAARDLAADMNVPIVLMEDDAGGSPFDEANASPWWQIAEKTGVENLPMGCFACTVELRGRQDIVDEDALRDAEGIYRFLARRGFVADDTIPAMPARPESTSLDAVDTVTVPKAGLVVYCRALGEQVEKGDIVAWLVDPAASDPKSARTAIKTETSGLLFTKADTRLVNAGSRIVKVAGKEKLSYRQQGSLLED